MEEDGGDWEEEEGRGEEVAISSVCILDLMVSAGKNMKLYATPAEAPARSWCDTGDDDDDDDDDDGPLVSPPLVSEAASSVYLLNAVKTPS